jgi:hypothetical protein
MRAGCFSVLLLFSAPAVAENRASQKKDKGNITNLSADFTINDWAVRRLRHEAMIAAQQGKVPAERLPRSTHCPINIDKSDALSNILSNADPRARQELGMAALKSDRLHNFVCHYRDALDKVLGDSNITATQPQLPDVAMAAREASVQLILQAIHACGRCQDASLLKTVAAGSAIAAGMYPEALRLLFELLETQRDLRDVYESVQKIYAARQRGKGEVSLSSPR